MCVCVSTRPSNEDLGSINTSFEDPHRSFLINLGETGLFHFPSGTLYQRRAWEYSLPITLHSSLLILYSSLVHRNKGSKTIDPDLRVSPHPTSYLLGLSRCHPSTLRIRISSLLRTYDIHPMPPKHRSDARLAARVLVPAHPSE